MFFFLNQFITHGLDFLEYTDYIKSHEIINCNLPIQISSAIANKTIIQ